MSALGTPRLEDAALVMAAESWRLEDDPANAWGSAVAALSRGLLSRRASGPWQVRLVHAEAGLYLFEVGTDGSARVFVRRGPVDMLPAGAVEVPRPSELVSSATPDLAGAPATVSALRLLRRDTGRARMPAGWAPGGCARCGAQLPPARVECTSCGFPVPVLEGAHPGAGVSALVKATGFRDSSVPEEAFPSPKAAHLLVARTHQVGLEAARRVLAEDRVAGRARRLLLVPDAPGRLPKPLADQIAVITSSSAVTRVPWVEAWRWAPGSPSTTFTTFFPQLVAQLLG